MNTIVDDHKLKYYNCKGLNLDIENRSILVITMERCEAIHFSETVRFFNNIYETYSFATLHSDKIVKTTFKYKQKF